MKILTYTFTLLFLSFSSCLCANSPEFTQAAKALQSPNIFTLTEMLSQLKDLVAKNPDIVHEKDDRTGNTLLHYNAKLMGVKINTFLISKGANANAINKQNETPADVEKEFVLEKSRRPLKGKPTKQYVATIRPKTKKSLQEDELIDLFGPEEDPLSRDFKIISSAKGKKLEKNSIDTAFDESPDDISDVFNSISRKDMPTTTTDAFKLFRLNARAGWSDVVQAWQRLFEVVNPKCNQDKKQQAAENVKKINTAYDILKEHYAK